ncbi:GNAT family N-acetyltransferase [Devosia sp. LjRoot3]|uniref:GNAT family N-acetyltransferase n=1 Tax=Devosia sp. LjRoot3 TaxID=3342319 RepID=UPI003ECE1AD5
MSILSMEVTETPAPDDLDRIGKGLTSFNEADVGPAERRPLAILVHDSDGELVAGISGYTAWGWLYVQWLWVEEDQRGQSLAGQMLESAEQEARQRGCHGAYIDTFNPHALHVYQKAGYTVFGTLPNFPPGRTRSFLSKDL